MSEPSVFDKVIEIAKQVKLDWVEETDRGDMPPTLFVERGGVIVAVVMAPQVDKHAGLHAATICRVGFKADALTMVLDAHIKEEKIPEGMTAEEAKDQIAKNYEPGSMQKACDEDGACEKGEIADVLLCHRVDGEGTLKMWMMPYAYHGKGGQPFRWMEEHPVAQKYNTDGDDIDEATYTGFIPETMKAIMKQPGILEGDNPVSTFLKQAASDMEMSPERQLYHTGRAILRLLSGQGFQVLDLQEHPDGEESEPIEGATPVSLNDLIPDDVGLQIGKLMITRGEEPTFREELVALLKPHEATIKANGEKNKLDPEQIEVEKIADAIAGSVGEIKKMKAAQPRPPYKVKVHAGDGQEYLGVGTYVGDVPVYFIAMLDGSIQSLNNAEERPTPEMVAQMGGELVEAGDSPKIVMDDGTVKYGCQIWWEPLEEIPHVHGPHCKH